MAYYVVKKYDAGDVIASLLVMLLIIVLLGVVIFYVGLIVLIVVASIAASIGFVYSLVLYIISIGNIKKTNQLPRANNVFDAIRNFVQFSLLVSKDAFKRNVDHAKMLYAKTNGRKAISVARWFLSFLSLCLLIFGTYFVASFFILEMLILALMIAGALFIWGVLIALSMVAGLFFYFVPMAVFYYRNFPRHNPFISFDLSLSSKWKYLHREVKNYWKNVFRYLGKDVLSDVLAANKSYAGKYQYHSIFSPVRYFLLSLSFISFVVYGLYFAVMLLFFTVSFVGVFIVRMVTGLLALIFHHK